MESRKLFMNIYENKIIQEDLNILENNIDYNKLNGKTILITGATGMLASYIVYFLIFLNENIPNFNCKIILLVRNYDGCYKRFGEYIKKDYIDISIQNINEKLNIDENIDYIIHAASIAVTQMFKEHPIEVILPNAIGTYMLLELANEKKVEGFLFFSTGSVYGKIENKDIITEDTFGELNPLDVNSCYSESKRLAETLCRAYWNQKQVNTKIVRICHTYGPTLDLQNDERVFSEFVRNIINEKNIELKSDGTAVRNFCYITDAVEAFFRILLEGTSGEAYNLSNENNNVSIKELAERLVNLYSDKNLKIIVKNRNLEENYIENKYANVINFSNEKLKKLGWSSKVSIEEGFKRTIESFKN